jgi:hypothetical protein
MKRLTKGGESSLDLQTVRSESAEALTCLVEKILRHGDVNERRMDIAVPQIGREERQLVLRIGRS